jgi:hypothetical protein
MLMTTIPARFLSELIYYSEVPPRVIRRGKNVSSLDGMRSFSDFLQQTIARREKGLTFDRISSKYRHN